MGNEPLIAAEIEHHANAVDLVFRLTGPTARPLPAERLEVVGPQIVDAPAPAEVIGQHRSRFHVVGERSLQQARVQLPIDLLSPAPARVGEEWEVGVRLLRAVSTGLWRVSAERPLALGAPSGVP